VEKGNNDSFKNLRILGFMLIFLIVCGLILVNIADNDGCDLITGKGGLGCIGYGFAWYGCFFFVGLTVLLSSISFLLAIKNKHELAIKNDHEKYFKKNR
tara:strand:+ start:82 stop:378 length:297 start_codon:yes stop_codon:yes gene_type:complete